MLRGKKKHDEEAIASTNTLQVQQNWQDRDFLVSVQLGVTQLSAFLNDFDATTRSKLSTLDGKLARLERRMSVVEATMTSVDQGS